MKPILTTSPPPPLLSPESESLFEQPAASRVPAASNTASDLVRVFIVLLLLQVLGPSDLASAAGDDTGRGRTSATPEHAARGMRDGLQARAPGGVRGIRPHPRRSGRRCGPGCPGAEPLPRRPVLAASRRPGQRLPSRGPSHG